MVFKRNKRYAHCVRNKVYHIYRRFKSITILRPLSITVYIMHVLSYTSDVTYRRRSLSLSGLGCRLQGAYSHTVPHTVAIGEQLMKDT